VTPRSLRPAASATAARRAAGVPANARAAARAATTAAPDDSLGAVRVVKVGGRVQGDAALPAALAAAWRSAPGALVVVHGGGEDVSALQRRVGHEPAFIGGRRVTGDADIALLRMALSGLANKRLVAALVGQGVPAVGLSGEDGALLSATPGDLAPLGRVGRPTLVDVRLLALLLGAGYLPVVSPLARDAGAETTGGTSAAGADAAGALNVNGDDAAAALAAALGAGSCSSSPTSRACLLDGAPARALDAGAAAAAVRAGAATGGMAAKLDAATSALRGGVARVRIGDVAALADAGAAR
jgi:acetylglutamate kinase